MGELETIHLVAQHLAAAYWAIQDALTASSYGLAADYCRDLQREARRLEDLCTTHVASPSPTGGEEKPDEPAS